MSDSEEQNKPAEELPEQTIIDIDMDMDWQQQPQSTEPGATDPFDMQVSHKQISDRFMELLSLFDKYTSIMLEKPNVDEPTPKLKRARSEQLCSSSHCDLSKGSSSLCDVQASEVTLKQPSTTCEVSIQTSTSLLPGKRKRLKPKAKSLDQFYLPPYIFVEKRALAEQRSTVAAATATQPLPPLQKLRQQLANVGKTLLIFVHMVGHNLTYVFFVVLCCGCLCLVISRYYSFLQSNAKSLTQDLTHLRPR